MTGQKRQNIQKLKEEFALDEIKVRECETLKKGEISIFNVAKNA